MATSLAAQLAKIAENASHTLDLKAQKSAHGKSLIFEPRKAVGQSFDSLYALCHEGFQELCLLDGRFRDFQKSIFGESSQEQDRTQLTAAQNAELDKRLEAFLGLVGGRLRLNPAIKAVEWLVRRFRVHEYNTAFLLTTFLPYHTLPVFTTLLSILPPKLPSQYKFLQPYIRSLTAPPRRAFVIAATNDPTFASLLNTYVLEICNARQNYPALITFWTSIITESISATLDKARSGREAVQAQNEENAILRIVPTLNEGLAMKKVPELRIGCYMILLMMAAKGNLDDKLLTAMMEAVVLGWTSDTVRPGLVCLSILSQQREAKQFTRRLTKELLKVGNLSELLLEISKQYPIGKLANGLCLALIQRFGKTADSSVLPLIEHLVVNDLLSEAQAIVVVKSMLLVAYRLDDAADPAGLARKNLAKTLTTLAEYPGHPGVLTRKAMEDANVDMDELELKLETVIRPKLLPAETNGDTTMEDADQSPTSEEATLSALLSQLPAKITNGASFLAHTQSSVFESLCQAFIVSISAPEDLDQFDAIPLLQKSQALDEPFYISFYIRIWCGQHPVLARAAAIRAVIRRLEELESPTADLQAIIPYAIIALADPAVKVRKAAGDLIKELARLYPAEADKKKKGTKQWATNIYGPGQESKTVSWLSADHAAKLLRDVLSPALEECAIDKNHITSVIRNAINGSKDVSNSQTDKSKLPSALRSSILSNLASHVTNTSLYLAKHRLLQMLNGVQGMGKITRTEVLLPVLQQWAGLSLEQAQQHCQAEQIDIVDFDNEVVGVVVANDADGFAILAAIAKGELAPDRESLCAAVFRRFRKMWPSFKGDARLNAAQLMMDLSQWPAGEAGPSELAQGEAMDLLRQVDLTTDILLSFVNQLPTAAKLADKAPVSKRRRTSHGEIARTPLHDSKQLNEAIQKVTFVLQLIDSSKPEEHTALLKGLFNVLAELQHFKSQVGSELGYLQGLVLSSLLAIINTHKADPKLKLDRAAVRADLLVDCVQKTASPQVQNAALLLIASLADTAPELVLHSVMPIFTFMGSSVLRQNDEYSAHVIKQTITQVIPPLIASLRKAKTSPVTGAAELLLSFVAAYEHVPVHRRKGLYTSLVLTLGADEFLFAVIAMLADKYGVTENIKAFAVDLASSFDVNVQLHSAVQYLDLVIDVLEPKPTISSVLLSASESGASFTALTQLTLLPHLLSHKKLITHTAKLLERDDMDASRVRELYSSLLETVLSLADQLRANKKLHSACGDVLESLLSLLSTSEFVKSIESLLDRPNEELRRKILRSLQVRVDQESQSNAAARQAMLGFLPQLTAIIRDSTDIDYKHIAVACVDKISEKYGKKDLEGVAVAAETIASQHCLGQSDVRLQEMSLLCLASLVEILKEGIVSVLPVAIPTALKYMETSIEAGKENVKLHNAGYAFIGALVVYLPYMISGSYLDSLLAISNKSAEADLDDDADESRIQCLQLAAKQLDAKSMFVALKQNWAKAAEAGTLSLREYLNVLSTAIDKHSKAVVTKNSPVLSTIFLSAFDLRRQWSESSEDVSADEITEIEALVNDVAIKMIYKFNDATFRPIFSKLIEWAATGLPKKDQIGRILRLQSVYSFMAVFFNNLKSIVTSYATYLIDNMVEVLSTVNVKDDDSKELWARVLRTFVQCCEHDQDDFWQSPSHFDTITPALTAQFNHASSLPLVDFLVPALVELAAAADSADHHKELNSTILKFMRSESTAVRLAAVKAEQALTDRLGEEWLSMLPEMLPFISEAQEDDDEVVEKETHRWIVKIEGVLGESLDSMLQ